jgi:hypothetical protein
MVRLKKHSKYLHTADEVTTFSTSQKYSGDNIIYYHDILERDKIRRLAFFSVKRKIHFK